MAYKYLLAVLGQVLLKSEMS